MTPILMAPPFLSALLPIQKTVCDSFILSELCTPCLFYAKNTSIGEWFSICKKKRRQKPSFLFGGDKRDRTADLLTASQALSQLSYTPESEHSIV